MMTNVEFEELKHLLKDYPNKEDVIKFLKSINKCLDCRYNDNHPHNACYNCD